MVLSCWWAPAVLAASFTDTASLDAALKDAGNVDGVLQLTPPGANLVLPGPVGGSTDGLSLDGQAGMVLGNNTFRLMDMGATGLGGVANIEMSNGRTTGNGGALLAGGLSAGIVNSAFRGNQAANGGGVYLSGNFNGGIRTNIHFDRNTAAGGNGGGVYVGGSFSGGIRGLNGDAHFDSNTASGQGGGMYVAGAFSGDVSANYFADNKAGNHGGGLYVGGDFTGSLADYAFFIRNSAGYQTGVGDGGGLYVNGRLIASSGAAVQGAVVQNNTAARSGGGAYVGGGIVGDLIDAQFVSNSAQNAGGGGLYVGTGGVSGRIVNGNFTANAAGGDGGGIYLDNGGSVGGGIVGTAFARNSALQGDGGAVYAGSVRSGIANVDFSENVAGLRGGGVYLGADGLSGGLVDSRFFSNQAGADGGGLYAGGDIAGGISGTEFTGNSARGGGGALFAAGALSDMDRVNFLNNRALVGSGGAVNATALGNVSNTLFSGNQAGGDGGAVAVNSVDTTIKNGFFLNNYAEGKGGVFYIGTGGGSVSLTADADQRTSFLANADGTKLALNNSFYIDGGHVDLDMGRGAGSIFLYDPLTIANGSISTVTHDDGGDGGYVYWGGVNTVAGAGTAATVRFARGHVQFRPDYVLRAVDGAMMKVVLGGAVGSENLAMDLHDRDPGLAIIDFTRAGAGSSLTLGSNLAVVAPRSLLPQVGKYLLVAGGTAAIPDQAGLDRVNGSITESHEYKARFLREGDNIYLIMVYTPTIGGTVTQNTQRTLPTLECFLQRTHTGQDILSGDAFDRLKADLGSVPPEAVLTLGWVSLDTHRRVVEQARRMSWADSRAAGPAPAEDHGLRLWGGYLGSFGQSAEARRGYAGYDADSNGFVLGLDWTLGSNWSVGAYGGYTHTDTSFRGINADAESSSGHFGVFSRYAVPQGPRFTLDGAYSRHGNTLRRNPAGLGRSESAFAHHISSVGLEAAYDLTFLGRGRIAPAASVRHIWLRQPGVTEHGGPFDTRTEGRHTRFFTSMLGASVDYRFRLTESAHLTPTLELGWRHDYGGRRLRSVASFTEGRMDGGVCPSFRVHSRPRENDALIVRTGLEFGRALPGGRDWGLRLSYMREERRRSSDDVMWAALRVTF